MGEFLLEIYSEEIPARMQLSAAEQIKQIFEKEAKIHNVEFGQVSSYVTPQRLVLHVEKIAEVILGKEEEIKGPATSAPEKAVEGFCHSNSIQKSDLVTKQINNKEYYFANKKTDDVESKDVLEKIALYILQNFQWPKTMRWGSLKERWVRPIRNILCLFDDKIVNLTFANVLSTRNTYGHRFMDPGIFGVDNIQSYFRLLEKHLVVLDQEERKKKILDQTEDLANKLGVELSRDNSLIQEVTGLVEYPEVIIEKISDEFLKLPPEILITSMAVNQKYFSFQYPDGKFAPYFAVVLNILSSDESVVRAGNKKVLEARLHDAKFFFDNDCKKNLESRVGELKKVHFHAKLGSVYDKVQRIVNISSFIANKLAIVPSDVRRAALLCKADLTTEAVFEFTELQGTMGKYYALNDGEKEEVALAIEEHYWPISRNGPCPTTIAGSLVSIADKIDTIVGLFSANEVPTSSKDPFALRRAAIGVIRIAQESNLSINLLELIKNSSELFGASSDVVKQVYEFITQRLIQYLKEEGHEQDIINAVIDDKINVNDLIIRCKDLKKFFKSSDGSAIYSSIKRINKMLEGYSASVSEINKELFVSEYENELYLAMSKIEKDVASLVNQSKYFEALEKFGALATKISLFFDNVMINDPDERIKMNRLSLLKKIFDMVSAIANFSQIK